MGKHDKGVNLTWDETPEESYTAAENRKLKAENERLKSIVKGLERDAARMEKIYDNVVVGAKTAIKKWKAENASLKAELAQYEKALAKEVVGKYV